MKHPVAKRVLIASAIVIIAVAVGFVCYVNDYYRADEVALAAVADENGAADGVEVRTLSGGELAFVAANSHTGLIFYPGGKVQPEAYAALLERCAQLGVTCVLVKPPFNLAILNTDAAAGMSEQLPEIDVWLIGGHSLGGIAACDYASRHGSEFAGIVLLASYPSCDLSSYTGVVGELRGSEDGVLNLENYEAAQSKLPENTSEYIIEGGNHANFGNYGPQQGDNLSTITRVEQQEQTAQYVAYLAAKAA